MAILLEVEPTQGVTSMADPDQDNFATLVFFGARRARPGSPWRRTGERCRGSGTRPAPGLDGRVGRPRGGSFGGDRLGGLGRGPGPVLERGPLARGWSFAKWSQLA